MDKNLFFSAISKFALGVVCVGLLVFGLAGTWHYPNGWLLMAILFIPMFAAGLVMLAFAPERLRGRLQMREEQMAQKRVIGLSGLMFVCGFAAAGLEYRLGWGNLPGWVSYAAAAVFLLAYGLYAEVLRENAWLSRTVQVQQGQQVVDTGLYGVVRHPMYLASILLFLAMPLVLGSLISFAIFLVYPVLIVKRIQNEEEVLARELNGYAAYQQRVRYRLLPYIW